MNKCDKPQVICNLRGTFDKCNATAGCYILRKPTNRRKGDRRDMAKCDHAFQPNIDCKLRNFNTNECGADTEQLMIGCEKYMFKTCEGSIPTPVRSAPAFLHQAASIMEERGKQYDQPNGERSMEKTVSAFNTISGKNLTESEGWLFMQILKDVRQWQNPDYHADSAEDGVAYSALKAEALEAGD